MYGSKEEPKCVIISAGDFDGLDVELNDNDFCIACDAGFVYARQAGILPDLIVGDFDSASEKGPEVMRAIREIELHDPDRLLRLNVKKDETDTLMAVKVGLQRGYRRFYLYGALGGARADHSFANIQTLLYIKHHGAEGYIMGPDQVLTVIENETIRFVRGNTGMVSVFSLSEVSKGVSLHGLMYNMEEGTLSNDFPLGVSNEFIIDEEAEITVREGTLLVTVFRGQ